MSLCRLARGIMSLAFDAVEAVVFLFDWSDPADKIWADACDRLADTEAEEEVTEPREMHSRTEQGPVGNCSFCGRKDFISAMEMFDGLCADCVIVCISGKSSSAAPASAGDEHSGGSVPRSDVEPPESLILLTVKDIDDAAYAIWRHAETHEGAIRELWHELADKFEAAANAMK